MSAENVERIRASAATWDGVVLRPDERPFERIFSLEATAALVDPEAVYEDVVYCPTTLARRIEALMLGFGRRKPGLSLASGWWSIWSRSSTRTTASSPSPRPHEDASHRP
jgi:hypothetical protein